jgi:hypothetical protein
MENQKSDNKIFGLTPAELAITAVGVTAGILVVKNVIDKTSGLLGVNTEENNNAGITVKAWDPTYWRRVPSGSVMITDQDADALAVKIHGYSGLFWDSPGVVFDALKMLQTKAEVSQVANAFSKRYSYDLYTYLLDGGGFLPADGLSNSNLTKVNDYVKSLRDY